MKLEVLLLRHGQTQGNLEKRYIGKTDEPLLLDDTESMRKISALQKRLEQEGIAGSQKLFVSPMLRCRQTAELLFPGQEQVARSTTANGATATPTLLRSTPHASTANSGQRHLWLPA